MNPVSSPTRILAVGLSARQLQFLNVNLPESTFTAITGSQEAFGYLEDRTADCLLLRADPLREVDWFLCDQFRFRTGAPVIIVGPETNACLQNIIAQNAGALAYVHDEKCATTLARFIDVNMQQPMLQRDHQVLIIDDLVGEEVYKKMKPLTGYRAAWTSDPEKALDDVRQLNLSVVVMDMVLGRRGLDGIELVRRMRAIRPGLAVVALSKRFDPYTLGLLAREGVIATLRKPLQTQELAVALRHAVNRTALIQAATGNLRHQSEPVY